MKNSSSCFINHRANKKCWLCFCALLLPLNYLLNFLVFEKVLTDCYRYELLLSCYIALVTLLWKNSFFNFFNFLAISTLAAFFEKNLFSASFFFLFFYILIFNYVIKNSFTIIFSQISSSFTFCELTIIGQACFTILNRSCLCILSNFVPNNLPQVCAEKEEFKVLQVLFFGSFLALLAALYCDQKKSNVTLNYLTLGLGLFITYLLISIILKQEAIIWLVIFIKKSFQSVWLIVLWGFLFIITLLFSLLKINCSKTISRKFFHIIMIIAYTFGIKININLLYFISACLLWILTMLELLRLLDKNYVSKYVDMIMDRFRNENDKGPITLTHIYLLVGFSSPIWLSPTFTKLPLNLTAGLITVGYGDTAASVVGVFFGKKKWASSNRTLEGTFGAMLFQILGLILTCHYFNKKVNLICIIISSGISSLIEAKTNQIDNLILPFYFNITWLLYIYIFQFTP